MRKVYAYIVKNGIKYAVHSWTPKPEHGDWTTDIAFVLAKVFKAEPQGSITVEDV